MEEVTYQGMTFEPYIKREEIAKQVEKLAQEIKRDYDGTNPLFLCVLNGAFIFAADLFRACDLHDAEITFIRFKSYQGMASTGEVKEIMGLSEDITDRHVIIVEDIIDSGRTLSYLVDYLRLNGAHSVKTCTLLDKPEARVTDVKVDYCGFTIPDEFVVGYGLDYAQRYRNLPFIGVLSFENKDGEGLNGE